MGCTVRTNRHGYLAYRLRWKGLESHEGTGLRDTPANRRKVEARAVVMSEEMRQGAFDYLRWFPEGNKAHVFRPKPTVRHPFTVREYAEEKWLPRMTPPNARASTARTYRGHLRRHILPAFGSTLLAAITPADLEDFRARLTRSEKDGGQGLKMKTARDVIDATFRAIYRDARMIDRVVSDDPFAALRWPRKIEIEPDPFSAAERDELLAYFADRCARYYPFVYVLFWTGLRVGETVGLRWGDVDLRQGRLSIRRSRTLGEDNPPKTARSVRTIPLRPEVVQVLRAIPAPLHRTEDTFVFTTAAGSPIDEEKFVGKFWRRALRATGVRPRKFYATRHTFISLTLMAGLVNIKRLADYCGTSIAMIERHYARWMGDDTPEEIATLGGSPTTPGPPRELEAVSAIEGVRGARRGVDSRDRSGAETGTLPGTFRKSTASRSQASRITGSSRAEGGRFELPRVSRPWRFSRPLPSTGLGHPSGGGSAATLAGAARRDNGDDGGDSSRGRVPAATTTRCACGGAKGAEESRRCLAPCASNSVVAVVHSLDTAVRHTLKARK